MAAPSAKLILTINLNEGARRSNGGLGLGKPKTLRYAAAGCCSPARLIGYVMKSVVRSRFEGTACFALAGLTCRAAPSRFKYQKYFLFRKYFGLQKLSVWRVFRNTHGYTQRNVYICHTFFRSAGAPRWLNGPALDNP